ncbi:hypothetical protein PhCBS80983_g01007 [Powellomyces hirtus]|uniref:Uncharacterized protein n=1 Tax=Powellomyces hirtus TaxID=109895 RepID=A0A507ECP6_9FUNG|nr:hypothetical protein PhCBS80983_g01007 [Powellomyces hirtus]
MNRHGVLLGRGRDSLRVAQYIFELEDPESINHIVAFMTGVQAFPPGYAATVHFLWPSPNTNPQWQLLGMLSNEKPSAIFRLGGNKTVASAFINSNGMVDDTLMTPGVLATFPAKLGISVEPVEVVAAQISQMPSPAKTAATSSALVKNVDPLQLTTKILESLYNYCSSFAGPLPDMSSALFGRDWGSTFIPLKALQDW